MPELIADVGFLSPKSLDEALRLRAELGARVRVIAGGTDVMVWQEQGRFPLPDAYLSLWGLPELSQIHTSGQRIRVGALATYSDILASADLQHHYPCLCDASRQVGATQIQNRGTLGGNVVNASPAGDSLPVLAVADATLELQSAARGIRRVPFQSFFTGYRQTLLADDELLTAIELPIPPVGSFSVFGKVGSRRAQTISKVMGALRVTIDDAGRLTSAAVAFGSVAPTVIRLPRVESALIGHKPAAVLADRVGPLLRSEISPITDVRSTREYRVFAAQGLLRRFLRELEIGRG